MKVTATDKAPSAIGPYSQAISANGFLFASGQVALMPGTGEIDGATIQEQAERCCQNVKAILEDNGLGFEDVIKTTVSWPTWATLPPSTKCTASTSPASRPAPASLSRSCPKELCEIEVIAVCK